jgi:ComF family protein
VACRICQSWPAPLGSAASAVWLDSAARRSVHLLKYDGWWRLADAMAVTMARLLPIPRGALLVPVPLGAARQRSRGYNQSAKLAAALARRLAVRIDERLLVRRRETVTQTALTPEARVANVAGAFRARRRARGTVVLVDDVFTTGATLVAAADALIVAGAETVSAVTFARAERPLDAASRAVAISSSPGTI